MVLVGKAPKKALDLSIIAHRPGLPGPAVLSPARDRVVVALSINSNKVLMRMGVVLEARREGPWPHRQEDLQPRREVAALHQTSKSITMWHTLLDRLPLEDCRL